MALSHLFRVNISKKTEGLQLTRNQYLSMHVRISCKPSVSGRGTNEKVPYIYISAIPPGYGLITPQNKAGAISPISSWGVLQSTKEYYRALQSTTRVQQSTTKYYSVLQSTTELYGVLQSNRVLQSATEYLVFLYRQEQFSEKTTRPVLMVSYFMFITKGTIINRS